MPNPSTRLGPLARALAGVLLVLAGLVFVASAVVAGLIATVGVALWALLSGRRSVVFEVVRRGWQMRRQMRKQMRERARGDVVDVEAREVGAASERRDAHRLGRIEPPRGRP